MSFGAKYAFMLETTGIVERHDVDHAHRHGTDRAAVELQDGVATATLRRAAHEAKT